MPRLDAAATVIEVPRGQLPDGDLVGLYDSVGWSTYTADPDLLREAIAGSAYVVAAHDGEGELIGLARAVSDDASICYLQDLLIRPSWQRRGLGMALLRRVMDRYAHVRQFVLITDTDPGQAAFYVAAGLIDLADFTPAPLKAFARMR